MEEPEDNPYARNPDPDFRDPDELTEEETREQVEALREAVEYHDHRYYVENDPVISDPTYDELFDRLETLEEEFDLADPNSPTQRVGGEPLAELETVEHVGEMLSLDSSEDEEAVREFDERVREAVGEVHYSIEPKFDGFSIEIVYEDGRFDRAVTRGDGREGEDVSENVRTIRSVPLNLPEAPDELAVRGEIYMPRSGFQDLNERRVQEGKNPFANPRNAAAGTVRLHDPGKVADRPLDIYFYDVMEITVDFDSQRAVFEFLADLGLRVNEYNDVADDIDDFVDYREEMMARRDDLEYEIDGVVAKVDDFAKREQMGTTARHPRWAFAYKFPARTGESEVRKIVVQVGRTGKLTPVALLDPVEIAGAIISRATLHNEEQVNRLGVVEGATVTVERAGDVIPEIEKVLERPEGAEPFEMPDTCPVCDSEVVAEGPNHYCTGGVSCPGQLQRSLQHYADALDVEGIGEEVAETLVAEGFVEESVAELYDLEKEDIVDLEGWGEQSAENLLAEIESSKECSLGSFLFAIGIRHVGSERARDLAAAFTLDELLEAEEAEVRAVPDIGPRVAESIVQFFESERNRETIESLREAGVSPHREETGEEFGDTRFVFTGSVEGWTRDELIDVMERHGANVTSSVSSETDYLVVGENPGERKRQQAADHDVETIDTERFREEFLARVT